MYSAKEAISASISQIRPARLRNGLAVFVVWEKAVGRNHLRTEFCRPHVFVPSGEICQGGLGINSGFASFNRYCSAGRMLVKLDFLRFSNFKNFTA